MVESHSANKLSLNISDRQDKLLCGMAILSGNFLLALGLCYLASIALF